jgi:hypothetical protein
MPDELLEIARNQAEQAEPSVRAAALLRIARVEATLDNSRARATLLEGLDAVRKLSGRARDRLLQEARTVAAAVAPDLLADIPITPHSGPPERFAHNNMVMTMLAYGHLEAAFDYTLREENSTSFPFSVVGNVLRSLDPNHPASAARRLMLLRGAVDAWRRTHFDDPQHERNQFMQLFAHSWSDFPSEEALAITRTIVAQATSWPDMGTSAGYPNEIRFTSNRQHILFQILHILRHLDPELAESLIDSHDQLAAAVRRYPSGLETINAEAHAEAERRRAQAASAGGGHGGGYLATGDARDRDAQRRLIDATRSGDFAPSLEDAIEKYREDTEPATRNYAPKEYWPSTGAFRRLFYEAGKRLGSEAATLLERIPDDDLRLFATIELAAAQAGAPADLSISHMKQPRPTNQPRPGNSPQFQAARIIASMPISRESADGPAMRSPDGRLVRCPQCLFQPPADHRWICKCDHVWNAFETAGHCPSCHVNWAVVICPRCGEVTDRQRWYAPDLL